MVLRIISEIYGIDALLIVLAPKVVVDLASVDVSSAALTIREFANDFTLLKIMPATPRYFWLFLCSLMIEVILGSYQWDTAYHSTGYLVTSKYPTENKEQSF